MKYGVSWFRDPAVPLDRVAVVAQLQRLGFGKRLTALETTEDYDLIATEVSPAELPGRTCVQLWLDVEWTADCIVTFEDHLLDFDLDGLDPELGEIVVHAVLAAARTWPGTRGVVLHAYPHIGIEWWTEWFATSPLPADLPDRPAMLMVHEDGGYETWIDPECWLLPVNRR